MTARPISRLAALILAALALAVCAPASLVQTLSTLVPSEVIITGGNSVTEVVTLTSPAPLGGTIVTLASSSPVASLPASDFVTIPASVTVLAGATQASFTIATPPTDVSYNITITAAQGTMTTTALLHVSTPAIEQFIPLTTIGGTMLSGSLTLTGIAPQGGIDVNLEDSEPSVVSLPSTITVPAGASAITFPVTTTPVSSATTTYILVLTTSYKSPPQRYIFTILPPSVASLSLSPASVTGGASSTGTVTLNGPAPTGSTAVSLASSSPSATVPSSVTVPAGSTSATFPVSTSAVASATAATLSAAAGGATQTATLTVNPVVALTAPIDPSAVSTGSGKISLYWTQVSGANGYNVYRGTAAGGEDYAHPVNGATPVNTLSYPGGNTDIFTDIGLTNGSVYYYTIEAVGDGSSQPSNEDSDTVDPQAVPWDTNDPSRVLPALEALSDESIDGPLRAMGPDGEIYESGVSSPMPPDGTPSVDSNVWDLHDGTTLVVPDDDLDAGGTGTTLAQPAASVAPPTPSHHTGPLREVISQPGYRKCFGTFILAQGISLSPYTYPSTYTRKRYIKATHQYEVVPIGSTGDTPYILLGSFGNDNRTNVDAGLAFQDGVWKPYIRSSLQKDPINFTTQLDPIQPTTFPEGDQVEMVYYTQTPPLVNAKREKVNVFCKITSDLSGDSVTISAFVDHHPADGTGVRIKREHSVAQNLAVANGDRAAGYRRTGTQVNGTTWMNGHLVTTGTTITWGPMPNPTYLSDLFGPVSFPPSPASTPYSFEPSIDIDL